MNCDSHEFVSFSTCLGTREVMVQCVTCGAFGVIANPTRDEWSNAAGCVRVDTDRVTIKPAAPGASYVERSHGH